MSSNLGISENVIFTGRVSDKEVPIYYNLADVCVFPTLRIESFGLVLAEAMAFKKPVIASNIDATPTVIENKEDGILVEPGNLGELEESILEILSNEEWANDLANNARKKSC